MDPSLLLLVRLPCSQHKRYYSCPQAVPDMTPVTTSKISQNLRSMNGIYCTMNADCNILLILFDRLNRLEPLTTKSWLDRCLRRSRHKNRATHCASYEPRTNCTSRVKHLHHQIDNFPAITKVDATLRWDACLAKLYARDRPHRQSLIATQEEA
jgi:hypothetical protein